MFFLLDCKETAVGDVSFFCFVFFVWIQVAGCKKMMAQRRSDVGFSLVYYLTLPYFNLVG